MTPDSQEQRRIYDEAMMQFRAGDMKAVAAKCNSGLQAYPGDANLMCLAARSGIALRQFDVAREHLKRAIALHPGFALAHDTLGDLRLTQGNLEGALRAYKATLNIDPARTITTRKMQKAEELLSERTLAEGPRQPREQMAFEDDIRNAEELESNGEQNQAEEIYRNILRKDPDHVEASRLLARIAVSHERYAEAEIFLLRAVELAPQYLRAWADLANAQRLLEKYDEGRQSAAKVIELSPDVAESYMLYAGIIGVAGDHESAIESYRKALELAPTKAAAMCSMAHHLKTIGDHDEAVRLYRASIAAKPEHCESYWSLANLKTFRFEQSEVEAMQQLLQQEDLPDVGRAQIHNALGLQFEAEKNYDEAFTNFEKCNIVRRQLESYDPVDTESTHDRIIELFTEEFLQQPAGETTSTTPVFVVGLPRSGSTLIEQILASHSQVEGTHELNDLSQTLQALKKSAPKNMRFPELVSKTKSAGWSRIGAEYLERSSKHRQGSAWFVDKNPNNFAFIGLLKLAIPNAKIVNARRHPLDSCLGSYKQLFASGQPFSYDMTELAEYYLQYQRLMDHWHNVIPGFVLDVHYESVVSDLDTEVRRILAFCGLPFEEACLRFHETERAVKTASSEQVRRPIYSTSVNLWRNYEHRLETLIHIMEPLLNRLSDDAKPTQLLQAKPKSA